MAQEPPKAAKRTSRVERHGDVADDPYAWLRAENWREVMLDPQTLDADIRAYLEAENVYTRERLAPVEELRRTLFAEMKGRIKEDNSSVPARDGAYFYYRRFDTGGQHPIFCRRRGSEAGPEDILLNGPEEAKGHAFFRVARFRHSPDHRLGAYAVDLTGSEFYTIRFRELATGETLDERIDGAHGDLVGHRPGRLIRGFALFAYHLVRLELTDGLPRVAIRRIDDGEEHEIAFEEEVFDLGILPGHEYATTTLRFTCSSLAAPERTYDYDMETRERVLKKEQEVPSGHDPNAYIARRLHAKAADGELVPISVLHRTATPIDGTAPLLLYGYGAYGVSMPAAFSPNRLSLVDRGFVYAIAHVRGGTDKGRRWYLDGKLANKSNTFLDFIAAAEHLIAEGYSCAGNIAAQGGSAGGLLVGAVANMRPELFKAIVAEVPFVVVVNTISDATLPLTPPEWTEWGNPIEDAEVYRTIRAYSPYDNVGL